LKISWFKFGACALVWFVATAVHAQVPQVIAIRVGRLFDGKSGKVSENQVILVAEEKITAVGPADRVQIPPGAQVIDLSKTTVLPGLIDGHTHVFGYELDDIKPGGRHSQAPLTILANTERCSPWQMLRRTWKRVSRLCAI
jgi:imidazolonepropionase-like amidohydrolase